jgi:hypothetical protein
MATEQDTTDPRTPEDVAAAVLASLQAHIACAGADAATLGEILTTKGDS